MATYPIFSARRYTLSISGFIPIGADLNYVYEENRKSEDGLKTEALALALWLAFVANQHLEHVC